MMLSGLLIYYYFEGIELEYSVQRYLELLGKPEEIAAGDASVPASPSADRVIGLGFKQLSDAAMSRNPAERARLEGRTGELGGLYMNISENQLTLFGMKM